MAFLSKLRDRLFKSSSRIEEGIDAIVAEGGAADPEVPPDPTPPPVREPEPVPTPEAPPETPPAPDPQPEPEPDGVPPEPDTPEGPPDLPPEPGPQVPPPPDPQPTREPFGIPDRPDPSPASPPVEMPGDEPPVEMPSYEPPMEIPPQEMRREAPRPGLLGRLLGRGQATPVVRRALDDAMLESLEDLLIQADLGVDTALRVTANIAEGRMGARLSTAEIKAILAAEVARIMEPVARPLPLYPKKPQVVLVVGVNGSGKTTTIGKLACAVPRRRQDGGDRRRRHLPRRGGRAAPDLGRPRRRSGDDGGAGDRPREPRFRRDGARRSRGRGPPDDRHRRAAAEPRRPDGGTGQDRPRDPQADPGAPHNTILVLDATTGQNALSQVEIFRKIADVTGLVMTKLDGTAKGGVLVALADRFGLPIHAIGVGEQIDDLAPFDPQDSPPRSPAPTASPCAAPRFRAASRPAAARSARRREPRSIAASGSCPAPQASPIAPASHIDAPVVMFFTLPPEVKITPAARNATPAVTASIRRNGSTRSDSGPLSNIAGSPTLITANIAAATEIRIWVRNPAAFPGSRARARSPRPEPRPRRAGSRIPAARPACQVPTTRPSASRASFSHRFMTGTGAKRDRFRGERLDRRARRNRGRPPARPGPRSVGGAAARDLRRAPEGPPRSLADPRARSTPATPRSPPPSRSSSCPGPSRISGRSSPAPS